MGIKLDVLVGHPEHDLIFVGIQVAKASGLRDHSGSVMAYRQSKVGKEGPRFTVASFMEDQSIKVPEDYRGQRLRHVAPSPSTATEALQQASSCK